MVNTVLFISALFKICYLKKTQFKIISKINFPIPSEFIYSLCNISSNSTPLKYYFLFSINFSI